MSTPKIRILHSRLVALSVAALTYVSTSHLGLAGDHGDGGDHGNGGDHSGGSALWNGPFFNSPDQGFQITVQTPNGIPQHSGQSARLTGTIKLVGVDFGNDDHDDNEHGYVHGQTLLTRLTSKGYRIQAYWPDLTTPVSPQLLSLTSNDNTTVQVRFDTPNIQAADMNLFTLQIMIPSDDLAKMQKVQAKFDLRITAINALIAKLSARPKTDPEDLISLRSLRDKLQATSSGMAAWLAKRPDVLAESRFPLQVDNKVAGPSLNSSLMGKFRLQVSYDSGSLIDGEKTIAHGKVTNLSVPDWSDFYAMDLGHDEKDNQEDDLHRWVTRFYWGSSLLKEFSAQTIDQGQSLSFDYATDKLEPEVGNTFSMKIFSWHTKKHQSGHLGSEFANLALTVPVAEDITQPSVLAGATPDAQHSCVYDMQPVNIALTDAFGLLDPTTFQSRLTGVLNNGSSVGGDVTSKIAAATPDQGQNYVLIDSGALNPTVEGVYTFSTSSQDLAGNNTLPNPFQTTFRVNRTAPVISLAVADSVYTNKPYTNKPSMSFGVTVLDYFDRCQVTTTALDNGVQFGQFGTPSSTVGTTMTEGFNLFEVSSTNMSDGLSAEKQSFQVILDTIPAVLSGVTPANNAVMNLLSFPVKGKSNEPLLSATINGAPMTLSDDKQSFSGTFTGQTEGQFPIHIEVTDLATNVTKYDSQVTILLRALNGDLLSVMPDPDRIHLVIKGAPGATRPGLTVSASSSFLNSGSGVGASDGSFQIRLFAFTQATASATDPSLGRTDTATVNWGGGSSTLLSGVVKDTSGQLLRNATVSLAGLSVTPVVTDASGVFVFQQPVSGDATLVVDGSTVVIQDLLAHPRRYGKTSVSISIGLTQSNVLQRPIYLAPLLLDGSATQVADGVGTTVTDAHALGVSIKIPGDLGAANFPDGTHSGLISMATVSADVSTIKPFNFSSPTQVVALEPSGLTFAHPVQLTLPNVNHLPPGVQLVIMSMNSERGAWSIDGAAQVTTDGASVVTKPGMGIKHFSMVYASPIGPTVRQIGGADQPGADTFNGALTTSIRLPSYKSLGQDIAPGLMYKSSWAKPTALVTNLFDIPRHEISLDRDDQNHISLKIPICIVFCFSKSVDAYIDSSIRGSAWYEPDFITARFTTAGITGDIATFTGVPNRAELSYATDLKDPVTSQYLTSGIYPYLSKWEIHLKNIIVGTRTITQWTSEDAAPQVSQTSLNETRAIEQAFPQDLGGPLFVDNEIHSAAGRGWKIAGTQTIANPQGDRVMIEEADGSLSSYAVNNGLATLYDANGQGEDLSQGSDVSHWPTAYMFRPGSAQVVQKDLTSSTGTSPIATVFSLGGNLAGGIAFNVDPDRNSRDNYSSCNWWQEAYSYGSTPQQFTLLPSGAVLGSDSSRHLIFKAYGGTTSLLVGALGGPPASFNPVPNSTYYFKSGDPGGVIEPIRQQWIGIESNYCNSLGANCGGVATAEYNVPFNACGFTALASSGTLLAPGNSGTYTGLGGALNRPMGIIAGPRPNTVVIADTGNNRIVLADLTAGTETTIAGNSMYLDAGDGGPATGASIMHPRGVAYDAVGNLYISSESGLIRKVDTNGVISTFAGTKNNPQFVDSAPALSASLANPYGMVVDNQQGYLYVADTDHNRVVRVDFATRTATQVAGNNSGGDSIDGQAALAGGVSHPTHLGLDDNFNLIIVASGNNKIKRVNFQHSSTGVIAFAATSGIRPGVRKDGSGNWIAALVRNADGSWTRNYRSGNQVTFDINGRQVRAVDRIGNVTSFAYDSQGRLTSLTDPTNRSIVYQYAGNFLSTIQDPGHPGSPPTRFNYDPATGNLLSVLYPDGSQQSFTYRSDGLMDSQKDSNSVSTHYQYNEWNRLVATTHDSGAAMAVTDSGSQTVVNPYTSGTPGTLRSVGTEAGGVKDSVLDPNGNPVAVSKDARGYAGATTDAAGQQTQIVRNVEGKPTKITRSDGSVQTFSYDPVYGDLIQQADTATGITTSQTFDDFGNLLTLTNGRGYTYSTLYDNKGQITTKVDPLGHQTTYTYNNYGQAATSTNPNHLTGILTYDNYGNIHTAQDNAGHTTVTTYDAAGNVLTSTDANGHLTSYEHDKFNRLIAVVSPKHERTEYTYRSTGELAQIKDALGNASSFEYDLMGRVSKKTDSLGMVTLESYDSNGNLTQEVDPSGNVKKYVYNSDNKLITKILPDRSVSLAYDARKNLLQAKDNLSQVDLAYDPAGRLVSAETQGIGTFSNTPHVILSFGRDANGNRTSLTDPLKQTSYQFDELDRMTQIQVTGGTSQTYGFNYDAGSRLISASRPGGSTTLAFDSASFLQSIVHSSSGSPIASYTLTRDSVGNITQVAKSSSISKLISYDENSQVISATNPEATGSKRSESFGYDQIYNRKTDQDGQYNYDSKSQRLVSDYRYFYFYDNNGNLRSRQAIGITGEVTNYFYSSENQLTAIKVYQPGPGAFNPSQLWTPSSVLVKETSYSYDALGRRIQKVVLDHTALADPTRSFTRRYLYDGQEVLVEYDGNNQILARHTHSSLGTDDILATEVTPQGVSQKLAQSAGLYAYLKDSLGSIVDIADIHGNRLQHYVYSAFGMLLGIQDAVAGDITPNPVLSPYYTFAGRELDSESGFYYNRARYLDPSIGRFLQKDPHPGALGVPMTVVNSYAYAGNNPFNLTDPSGQSILGVIVGVVLIAIAVVVAAAAIVAIAAIAAAIGSAIGGAVAGVLGGGIISGMVGGALGGAAGGLIGGVIGSAAGGLAGGLVSGGSFLVGGGEFGGGFADAFSAGVTTGAAIGQVVGAAVGAAYGSYYGARIGAIKPAGADQAAQAGSNINGGDQLAWRRRSAKTDHLCSLKLDHGFAAHRTRHGRGGVDTERGRLRVG